MCIESYYVCIDCYNGAMSRPKTLQGARRSAVYLDERSRSLARELGAGNVSEGIRIALAAEINRRSAARVTEAIKDKSGDELLAAIGASRASDLPRK